MATTVINPSSTQRKYRKRYYRPYYWRRNRFILYKGIHSTRNRDFHAKIDVTLPIGIPRLAVWVYTQVTVYRILSSNNFLAYTNAFNKFRVTSIAAFATITKDKTYDSNIAENSQLYVYFDSTVDYDTMLNPDTGSPKGLDGRNNYGTCQFGVKGKKFYQVFPKGTGGMGLGEFAAVKDINDNSGQFKGAVCVDNGPEYYLNSAKENPTYIGQIHVILYVHFIYNV